MGYTRVGYTERPTPEWATPMHQMSLLFCQQAVQLHTELEKYHKEFKEPLKSVKLSVSQFILFIVHHKAKD